MIYWMDFPNEKKNVFKLFGLPRKTYIKQTFVLKVYCLKNI